MGIRAPVRWPTKVFVNNRHGQIQDQHKQNVARHGGERTHFKVLPKRGMSDLEQGHLRVLPGQVHDETAAKERCEKCRALSVHVIHREE